MTLTKDFHKEMDAEAEANPAFGKTCLRLGASILLVMLGVWLISWSVLGFLLGTGCTAIVVAAWEFRLAWGRFRDGALGPLRRTLVKVLRKRFTNDEIDQIALEARNR